LPGERGGLSPAVTAALVALGILAALYFAWPVWRAQLPLEIDSNEPWNARHADAVRTGQDLYPDPDGLVANNYPPLSFYLIGKIAALTSFDAIYVGRLLSLLATAATAIAVGFCVRQFGGSRMAALLAGLWFLATMARFFEGYVGMNDPHLLALAIMVSGLAWFIRRRLNGRAVEPAILVMVVAGFFKHTLLGVPATALCWLGLANPRLALRAALVGVGAAALGLAICGAAYGDAFFRELFMHRGLVVRRAAVALVYMQWIAPALLVFAIWAWHQRQEESVRFTTVFLINAFVVYFLQMLGAGVDYNAQFELTVAAAIGLALAFDRIGAIPAVQRWGIDRARLAIVLILIGRLLFSSRTAPYMLVASPHFRAALQEQVAVMEAETKRIAAIPGPVVCREAMTVCRRAGKSFVFDNFSLYERQLTGGKAASDEINRRVRAEGIRFEQVDQRSIVHQH
jgi:hypothetical protein